MSHPKIFPLHFTPMAYFHHRYSFIVMGSKYSYLPGFHQVVGFGCIFNQSKMALVFSLFCLFNYQGFLGLKTSQLIIYFIIGFRGDSMGDFHEKDFVEFLREFLVYCDSIFWFKQSWNRIWNSKGNTFVFWNSNSLEGKLFVFGIQIH